MKVIIAILFTILYTAFVPFAVAGFAASKCNYNTCTAAGVYQSSGAVNAENEADNCTHPFAITAHVLQKQFNHPVGSSNGKYVQSGSSIIHKNYFTCYELLHSNTLYSKGTTATSCPLFLQHRVLLI